jgi:alpha-tubulin suppressor-like RCC1 family protein
MNHATNLNRYVMTNRLKLKFGSLDSSNDQDLNTQQLDQNLNTQQLDQDLNTQQLDQDLNTQQLDQDLNIQQLDQDLNTQQLDQNLNTQQLDQDLNTQQLDLEEKFQKIYDLLKHNKLELGDLDIQNIQDIQGLTVEDVEVSIQLAQESLIPAYKKIVSHKSGNSFGICSNTNKLINLGNVGFSFKSNFSPGDKFVDVACGVSHCVGLKSDGTVCTWGNNFLCLKNEPTYLSEEDYVKTYDIPSSDIYNCVCLHPRNLFKKIACGDYHSVGIRLDGTIAIWGDPSYGSYTDAPGPYLDTWKDVVCLKNTTIGIRSDNSVKIWGMEIEAKLTQFEQSVLISAL